MMFKEFVANEVKEFPELQEIIEFISNSKGKKSVIIGHDDPDGITSVLILKRLFDKLDIKTDIAIPTKFVLEEEQLKDILQDKDIDFIVIVDKGTEQSYAEYKKYVDDVIIIDHHFATKTVAGVMCFNPVLKKNAFCSASYLTYMISVYLDKADDYDMYYTYLGLKGDWVIQPVIGKISDYVSIFYNENKSKMEGYLKPIESRATMFDADQRDKTCLLSQVAEVVHAMAGGGFQYFYNDKDEMLNDIYQPEFTYEQLFDIAVSEKDFQAVNSVDDFLMMFKDKEISTKLYNCYCDDWDNSMRSLETTTFFNEMGGVRIYLFLGYDIALLPMVGSIKVFELSQEKHCDDAVVIMINRMKNGHTHFSLRGTGEKVHCGKICHNLAIQLPEKYGNSEYISGGGHGKAAECWIRTDKVLFAYNLKEIIDYLFELTNYAKNESELTAEEKEKAIALGLDYLDN